MRTPTARQYRSFHSDFAEFGPATGYTSIIEGLPCKARAHFPTIAAARDWADQQAKGEHYGLFRETLSALVVPVGATCPEEECLFRFSGVTDVTRHRGGAARYGARGPLARRLAA